jgi:hypothetical protein
LQRGEQTRRRVAAAVRPAVAAAAVDTHRTATYAMMRRTVVIGLRVLCMCGPPHDVCDHLHRCASSCAVNAE